MKLIYCLLLIFEMFLMESFTKINERIPVCVVPRIENSIITIDGNLDEPVWDKIQKLILSVNESGISEKDSTVMTWVMVCSDSSKLYIAFICNDPDIWGNFTSRDDRLWKEEVVEVFIDTDNNPEDYIEIEVSPVNTLFDCYIVDTQRINVEEAAKFDLKNIKNAVIIDGTLNKREDQDCKWTVEIAIPYEDILNNRKYDIDNFEDWKINFYRVNRDHGKEDGKYSWSPTLGKFHTPSKFGFLRFNQRNVNF